MNQLKAIFGAIAFSIIFYQKDLGLNVLLSAIFIIGLLFTNNKALRYLWPYSFAYLLTAIMVFISPNTFQVFIHIMALFVLIGKSISSTSNLYLTWFIGLINICTASFTRHFMSSEQLKTKPKNLNSKNILYLKGGLISLVLLLVFVLLYSNANPIFKNILDQIDLSFISISWLFYIDYLFSSNSYFKTLLPKRNNNCQCRYWSTINKTSTSFY